MSVPAASRTVRLAVEEQFTGAFNAALLEACGEYGIGDLAYAINWNYAVDLPQNFYRENWTLDTLLELREPVFPALAMWTGNGAEYEAGRRSMPRTFSGFVFVHWRFFLAINGLRTSGLTPLREATESAMLACLEPELSEITYRKDLAWLDADPRVWLDQDQNNVGFLQQVEFQASFEVNA